MRRSFINHSSYIAAHNYENITFLTFIYVKIEKIA